MGPNNAHDMETPLTEEMDNGELRLMSGSMSSKAPAVRLLAMSIMVEACAGLPRWRPSAADDRYDSKRPKTLEDMERITAAQKKRDRKGHRTLNLMVPTFAMSGLPRHLPPTCLHAQIDPNDPI